MKIYNKKTALMKQDNDTLSEFNETLSKDNKNYRVSLKLPYLTAEDNQKKHIILFEGLKRPFSTADRQHQSQTLKSRNNEVILMQFTQSCSGNSCLDEFYQDANESRQWRCHF